MAGCQLNAAIGKYRIVDNTVHISSVYVYLRDTFDFINDSTDQYLGHWNKFGFNVFYTHHFLSNLNQIKDENMEKVIVSTNDIEAVSILASKYNSILISNSEDRYFPIRNSTYNKWREKHGKGGDLLIFSELKEFPCDIVINLK